MGGVNPPPPLIIGCRARTGAPQYMHKGCPLSEDGSHVCSRDAEHENGPADTRADHTCTCGQTWCSLDGGVRYIPVFFWEAADGSTGGPERAGHTVEGRG